MKAYGVVDLLIHVFLTSALVGQVSGQLHGPIALSPEKEHTVSIG
jgi:hypothetical protein